MSNTNLSPAWKHRRGKSAGQKEVKKDEGNNVLLLPVIYLNLIVGDIVARFNLPSPSSSVFCVQLPSKIMIPVRICGCVTILAKW